ncbi:MAG: TIGR03767 family metallophosphoesterase [Nocardioides sp.]
MKITRRGLIGSSAVMGGAAALPIDAATATSPPTPRGTVDRVLRRGKSGAGGYARLVRRGGEKHRLRTDLGVRASRGRATRRRPLTAFVQLSDIHVIDAQSPLRVEYVDRFDDPSPVPTIGLFGSAYRPQEMLSAQIADAMVREINAIGVGPVTGRRLELAIQTGDNSDNSQLNEVRWNIDLLDGERVRPDSGDLRRYEGVADNDPLTYDPAYWHPDKPPRGQGDDLAKTQYGFPTVPGLLDAARRPFRAQGLRMPWYAVFGNHDGLVQGNFPADTLQLDAIATGPLKIISPPAGFSPGQLATALIKGDLSGFLGSLLLSPGVRQVTADRARRLIARADIVAEHFKSSGRPRGHGFTASNRRQGTAYYTFDRGRCRFIVLDTVNPNGYADGSIDQTQFTWLQNQLHRSTGRVVMIFSHHTSSSMNNPLIATGADLTPRVLGDQVLGLLLAHPEVVAWVNGHTHRNEITGHKRGRDGGMWEINTASHIDWPQQSRIIELTDNRDGTLSIFTTMVDHSGPLSYGGELDDTQKLASLARELAANDWHDRSDSGLGDAKDRNVELVTLMPRA